MMLLAEQPERLIGRSCNFTAGHRVPSLGMLAPGLHAYLPVPAALGSLLYLKAATYKRAEKDVIRLQGDLRKQQGLYSCPPG